MLPRLLAECRSDHLDYLAGRYGSYRAALPERKPFAQAGHESGRIKVARARGVDTLGCGHDANVHHLVAALYQRAFHAYLHDRQLAHARESLQRIQRLLLAGKGMRLVFIGEDDVDIFGHQFAQKAEVFGHDVERCQIDRYFQSAPLGLLYGRAYQTMILHQITFDIETVVTGEYLLVDLLGSKLARGTQMRDHSPLAVGRDERHALARANRAAHDERFDAEILQCLLEEIAGGILTDLADEAHLASQTRHGAYRIGCRSAQRERIRVAGHRLRYPRLRGGIGQIHRAFRQ